QAGQGQSGGRPPRGRSGPPGRGPGGPPRDRRREEQAAPPPPPPPPPPPRKPRREAPKPKLTQAAMEGKTPLRTLAELAAFFAAKEGKDKPAPPPQVAEEQPPETPPVPMPPEAPRGEAPAS